ncbi:MAG: 30S ribosome-binding factor RbfA [Oscillospiraceae bacterium]|nr:30S ribosome-binding factor RbfA [Oscillospiraceae bacterium]
MANYKLARMNEDVKRELSDIMGKLKDPRISGFLTIVKVELSRDLSYCKVYVSSIDGYESAENAVKGLASASGYIKRELGPKLGFRKMPEFKFIPDNSAAVSAEIFKKLKDIESSEKEEQK